MSDLPHGWALVTLGEMTAPRGEKADPSNFDDLPFIGLEEVEAHTGRVIRMQTTTGLKSAVALFNKGDLLYGRLRPYLNKVVLAEGTGAASAEFIVLPPSEALDQSYLQRTLMSPDFIQFTGLRSTGDRPRVSFEGVSDYQFPLPPLPEQRRIVTKINSLTGKSRRARDHLDHIPRLVEKYKQTVLAVAFRGELTREWSDDGTVESGGYDAARLALCEKLMCRPWKVEQSTPHVKDAPDRWRKCYVGQLVAHRSGIAFESADFSASGQQVVRLGNLYQGRLDLTRQPVFLANPDKYSAFVAKGGDILVSQTGTKYKRDYGHFVIVPENKELLINQRVACLTPTADLNGTFLAYYSQTSQFRDYFFGQETGGVSQGNVGLSGIMDAPLALPSRSEQDEIVRRIDLTFSLIDRLSCEATSARKLIDQLDQAVLSKALRGELVSQDPEDEPTNVLLKRVRAERGFTPKSKSGRMAKPK